MNKKIIVLLLISYISQGQMLELFDPNTQWILTTAKIEKNKLEFIPYSVDKVDMNTMIWTFMPGGIIDYDYQSSADIFACAGVDFLDMDVTECRWEYDSITMELTLLIKGGYASIDDFVFKRRYTVSINDEDDEYAYTLTKNYEFFFNDLTKSSRK